MDKDVLECMSKVKDYYLGKSKLNTKEVLNILLGENKSTYKNESDLIINNNCESSIFDMEELLRWKNKNNDKYEITSYWAITSHRKFVGKLLIFGKKVTRKFLKWYIDPIVEQQNEFNGSVTASINALYNNDVVTQEFIKCPQSNTDLEEKINRLEEINKELQESNKLLSNKLEKLIVHTNEINDKIDVLSNETVQLNNKAEDIAEQLTDTEDRINEDIDYVRFKVSRLSKVNKIKIQENNREGKAERVISEIQENKENETVALNQYGIDYFEFENRFRGSCKKIKETQTIYVKYFKDKENILDIGCGRGEFLELLYENNIKAKGIDVCEEFIEYCEYKKLDATFEDGVSYLNKINDNSVGGVFMSQVAEHLETGYLIELVSKVYNKLEKGSYFIAETPNPTMLSTFSNSFYLDPSHKNPVHPETFKFILQKVGFKDIEILFTDSSKIQYNLPLLDGSNINNLAEFNNGVNLLSNLLFGSQDYAIIARK